MKYSPKMISNHNQNLNMWNDNFRDMNPKFFHNFNITSPITTGEGQGHQQIDAGDTAM